MTLIINPPVIAHRGASGTAPENTLIAFRKAKEYGAKWVEFDVMLTACGELVVIHDDTVERTTNGRGRVIDCTYKFLLHLDAGSWFHQNYAHERIPTLRQVITLLNELGMSANIEIKTQPGHEDYTVRQVLQIVDELWENKIPPLFSSFDRSVLDKIRHYSAAAQIGYLMHNWEKDWKDKCDALHAVSVNVNQLILDQSKVAAVKATKYALLTYTVNTVERAKELFGWGVDAVFSDYPDIINSLLPERFLRGEKGRG